MTDKYLISIYEDLERDVISDIARRCMKTGRYTETAELMADAMRSQGFSAARIQTEVHKKLNASPEYQKELAENTLRYKSYVVDRIKEAEAEALASGDMLTATAGAMSYRDDLSAWSEPPDDITAPNYLKELVKASQKVTQGTLRNITRTSGFKGTWGECGVMNAYQRTMDLAALKVSTGAFSYDRAIKDAVLDLSKRGLRSIDYGTGRSYELDTAVRMCIRTSLAQLTGKIQEENMKQVDTPLVYVDAHAGARPEHAVWQGQVYAYDPNGTLRDGTKAGDKYDDFEKSTDYGSVTGLMGVNCAHHFYPYWEGDPIPEFKEPGPFNVDGKEYTYYEATQQMRKQEREIRGLKREIEARKVLGMDVTKQIAKLNKTTSEYYGFSNATSINPRRNALTVKSGTSNLSKTSVLNSKKIVTTGWASLDGFNKKQTTTTRSRDLAIANYRYGQEGYTDNCVKAFAAYVARTQGYDVTAQSTIDATKDEAAKNWKSVYNNIKTETAYPQNAKSIIDERLANLNNGDIMGVRVIIKENEEIHAHLFAAEKKDGSIIYSDPQNPDKNATEYFRDSRSVLFEFGLVSDKEPTELIKECVENYDHYQGRSN